MSLSQTPRANRLHIGIFGKRNSGKSTLINALVGQRIALVSEEPGATADPVFKAMEIHGLGPCVFIDTAGFDDEGSLGTLRVEKTREVTDKCDIALLVCSDSDLETEREWWAFLKSKGCPVIPVLNKADLLTETVELASLLEQAFGREAVVVSALEARGMARVIEEIARALPPDFERPGLVNGLIAPGETALLVMPQDTQAPKGRLILPQVQVLRDLLDKGCMALCTTNQALESALSALAAPPTLLITDSQLFAQVAALKPPTSRLTSFSILMAQSKGDIAAYLDGAKAIDRLTADSRVLISEACTHAPLEEDIGRVKIPRMLRARAGEELTVDVVSGVDFPEDLSGYDLVIQCGCCMFGRRYVLSRIGRVQAQQVPITNYGVALAALTGALAQVDFPQ